MAIPMKEDTLADLCLLDRQVRREVELRDTVIKAEQEEEEEE